jgi:hypothetical protein
MHLTHLRAKHHVYVILFFAYLPIGSLLRLFRKLPENASATIQQFHKLRRGTGAWAGAH